MTAATKVLVTGTSGQVGRALRDSLPPDIEWLQPPARIDIADRTAVAKAVEALRPTLIINAAAYTAVDKAESDRENAYAVNRDGAGNVAAAARAVDARLIHISTDFIFNGRKGAPYQADDATDPLSVYGDSKLEGERAVQAVLGESALIVRTAWVHYPGGANFVRTMLRLMRERPEVRVIADQIGTPTHAGSLARALWSLAAVGASGIHHWTDSGIASWYDFAQAIRENGIRAQPQQAWARVIPIETDGYPTPAKRPGFSVLDKRKTWDLIGIGPHWRESLDADMARYLSA